MRWQTRWLIRKYVEWLAEGEPERSDDEAKK